MIVAPIAMVLLSVDESLLKNSKYFVSWVNYIRSRDSTSSTTSGIVDTHARRAEPPRFFYHIISLQDTTREDKKICSLFQRLHRPLDSVPGIST